MIILPDRNIVRTKFLPAIPTLSWRAPSAAQPKDQFGRENFTAFYIEAYRAGAPTHYRGNDGYIRKHRPIWRGYFKDRFDADAFFFALICGSIKFERALWDLPTPCWCPDVSLGEDVHYQIFSYAVFTSGAGSNQTWTAPGDWAAGANSIELVAGGGSGSAVSSTGLWRANGGTGGAYSKIVNYNQNTSATYRIGTGGTGVSKTGSAGATSGNAGNPSWFNNTVNPGAGSDNTQCSAAAGAQATGGATTSGTTASKAGGLASASWGTTKFDGGGSGSATCSANGSGPGGGGAAGPDGAGGTSSNATDNNCTAGGNGDNGSDGAGSAGVVEGSSSAGSAGTKVDSTHGYGGASGGATRNGAVTPTTGAGGNYGAGSGPCGTTRTTRQDAGPTGAGAQGMMTVTWTPGGTNNQSANASHAQGVTLTRATQKNVSVGWTAALSVLKTTNKNVAVSHSVSAAVSKTLSLAATTISTTIAQAISLKNTIFKQIAATAIGQTVTASVQKAALKAINATQAQSISVQRSINKILAIVQSAAVSVRKAVSTNVVVAGIGSNVALKNTVSKIISAAAIGQLVSLITGLSFKRTLNITQPEAISATKGVSKNIPVVSQGESVSAKKGVAKIIAAGGVGSAVFLKNTISKIVSAAPIGQVVSLVSGLSFKRVFSLTQPESITATKAVTKIVPNVSQGQAVLVRRMITKLVAVAQSIATAIKNTITKFIQVATGQVVVEFENASAKGHFAVTQGETVRAIKTAQKPLTATSMGQVISTIRGLALGRTSIAIAQAMSLTFRKTVLKRIVITQTQAVALFRQLTKLLRIQVTQSQAAGTIRVRSLVLKSIHSVQSGLVTLFTPSALKHWPDGVPMYALIDSYSESPESNLRTFTPELGPPKVMRQMSQSSEVLKFNTVLTSDQYDTLLTFYRTTLKDGSMQFTMTHPRLQQTKKFRFVAAPAGQFYAYNAWSVAFQIRRVP